jgi:hypothetical protein
LVSDAADETAVTISRAGIEMARARYPDVTAFLPFAPRVSVTTEHIEWQPILTDILQIGAAGAIGLICNRRASESRTSPYFLGDCADIQKF